MASSYAAKNQEKVEGLILLGSYIFGDYPEERALTIYGSLNQSVEDKINYTKNIVENIKKLDKVKQDLEYASDMCTEVISIYTTMDIPQLSNDEYTKMLIDARNDVKTAYELREKAMESAITLINTKNPKYIGKITEYLNLSDNYIANFKDRLTDLNQIIDEQ